MRCNTRRCFLVFAAMSSGFGLGAVANAADTTPGAPAASAAADGLEEVIVTAEKTSENLQKAPTAISVISGDQMIAQGATDIRSIDTLVPGIDIGDERDSTQIFVRGIGSNVDTTNTDPAVDVNMNEVYLPRNVVSTALYDIDRTEVLYGPQGTLYGRNAAGGVINFNTKAPGDTLGGEGFIEGGDYSLFHPSAAVNIPVSDELRTRLAFNYESHDGYLSNGLDDEKSVAGRLTAVYTPMEQLSVTLLASIFHNGGFGNAVTNLPAFNPRSPWYDPGDPEAYGRFRRQSNQIVSANFKYTFGERYTLTYIPAYVNFNDENDTAADGTTLHTNPAQTQYTQELRLAWESDRLKWQTGLYWFKADSHEVINVTPGNAAPPGLGDPPLPANESDVAPGYLHIHLDHLTHKTSYAGFGQMTYSLLDDTRLTAGLRYSWDQTDGSGNDYTLVPVTPVGSPAGPLCANFLCPAPGLTGIPNIFTGNQITRDLSWKIALDHDLNATSMIYASVQTGYTEGGFYFAPAPDNVFRPQYVLAFAAGSKNRFLDDRLEINDEAFYYDYRDYQITVYDLTTSVTDYFAAHKAVIYGDQLDAKLRLTRSDLLSLSTTVMSPKAIDFSTPISPFGPGGQTNFDGYTLPFAPEVTFTASLQHTWNLPNGASLDGLVASHYEDSKWGVFQHAPGTAVPSYDKTDVTLTYTSPGRAWSLALWGKNLNNAVSYVTVATGGNPGPASALIDPPRTYGARVGFRF
jgi:iron complex outermembrane recepter protein